MPAVVNPRGSGAYGEDWYRAGAGPTKANTWRDMIDCGHMLIAERYTTTAKLAIVGAGMGGMAAGRAITEMGSPRTRAGIEQLLAMSSYHQVKDGTRYPAVFLHAASTTTASSRGNR